MFHGNDLVDLVTKCLQQEGAGCWCNFGAPSETLATLKLMSIGQVSPSNAKVLMPKNTMSFLLSAVVIVAVTQLPVMVIITLPAAMRCV